MLLTQISWALLFLPGYALLRRYWPEARSAGLLQVLALSYAGSFALLSPMSIACYALGAPLWVFSAACVLTVAGSALWLALTRADRELGPLLRQEPVLPWLLLALHLVLQGRVGGYLLGDAHTHLGRIRYLLEHGFSNRDIYLADYHFHHIYHTNLLYALYASVAQLTHQHYLDAWFWTQPWAKLLVAAGHYGLGYALSGKRWVAWSTALVVVTANAGESYSLYPNTLSVGFLLPLALGMGLSTLAHEARRSPKLLTLAMLSFVIGQVHSLYAIYAGFLLGPVLAVQLARRWWRGQRARWLLLALCALLAGAPFVLVSKYAFLPKDHATPELIGAEASVREPPAWAIHTKSEALLAGGGHLEKQLRVAADGRYVFPPELMGGRLFVLLGMLSFGVAFYLQRERRAVWFGAELAALSLSAVLFLPAGCMLALRVLLEPFSVARLSTVLTSLLFAGLCAVCVLVIDRLPAQQIIQPTLTFLLCAFSTQLLGHAPRTFTEHVQLALSPLARRHETLDMMHARQTLLATAVPKGETVLTTAGLARPVVMLCDCFVIAADRGHTHVLGIGQRRADVDTLNHPATAWPVRQALLAHYGVRTVVFEQSRWRNYRWATQHGQILGTGGGLQVVRLR